MRTHNEILTLQWLPGRYAICRLAAREALPTWAQCDSASDSPDLHCVTRTKDEVSIVAAEELVPANVRAERGFIAMRIAGTLEFSMVGILARLTGALADAKLPVFAISTFDTDVLLIRSEHADRATAAMAKVAHFQAATP